MRAGSRIMSSHSHVSESRHYHKEGRPQKQFWGPRHLHYQTMTNGSRVRRLQLWACGAQALPFRRASVASILSRVFGFSLIASSLFVLLFCTCYTSTKPAQAISFTGNPPHAHHTRDPGSLHFLSAMAPKASRSKELISSSRLEPIPSQA